MDGMTDRQLEVLRFIAREIEERGYPPTIREIGEALDIRSTNGVNDHLKALERKGFLTRDPVKSRALIPTASAREALGGGEAKPAGPSNVLRFPGGPKPGSRLVEVPIIGRVAAGQPILAQERIEDTVQVDSFLLGTNKKVYGLKVQGDSMIGDGILPGDYIFVKKQLAAVRRRDRGRHDRRRGDREAGLLRGEADPLPALQPAHGPHLRRRGGLPLDDDPGRGGRRLPEDAVGSARADPRPADWRRSARPSAGVTRTSALGVLPPRLGSGRDAAAPTQAGTHAPTYLVFACLT